MKLAEAGKKAGELTAITVVLAVIGSLWIDREVERRMDELATDPADIPEIVALTTQMKNVEAAIVRVEGKVDTFSQSFMEYLQRLAEN